ncbi:D-aminoacyl-tRNA deacylase-like [Octopus vulgaris]|uniref:D-aminoacyl-tRNA deacylase n=1 Tax=Octopus vulgaris TaxID=6645 RepID=A0AA36BWN7_OCTVU|nr:D-aminoacyl-tRNA deacylase-like [Octopus vulgaris]
MKIIVQRVAKASVSVNNELVSSIGKGLCLLVGIGRYDTMKEMEYMVRKVLNLRVFEDDNGKRWNKSVKDRQLEVLCVSQFTLMCSLKGNKPDYHDSMGPDLSQQFYNNFLAKLREAYDADKVKDGRFGAYMSVNIENDGPVTIPLEITPSRPKSPQEKEPELEHKID